MSHESYTNNCSPRQQVTGYLRTVPGYSSGYNPLSIGSVSFRVAGRVISFRFVSQVVLGLLSVLVRTVSFRFHAFRFVSYHSVSFPTYPFPPLASVFNAASRLAELDGDADGNRAFQSESGYVARLSARVVLRTVLPERLAPCFAV